MFSFERTTLWENALGGPKTDNEDRDRARLREAFLALRRNAEPIAATIRDSSPELTVHDISHTDALWETADEICGLEITLTPVEAFTLGASFVAHDLGLSAATYPRGVQDLRNSDEWLDAFELAKRNTAKQEVMNGHTSSSPEQAADLLLLRQNHAKQAEKLMSSPIELPGGPLWLIEDLELRRVFGALIGELAKSHWWSAREVSAHFRAHESAVTGFPRRWTLNRLKLACLLRLADAAQLDRRRAPVVLRMLQNPAGDSALHWDFQERLEVPVRDDDRLVYTSFRYFEPEVSAAWWLAYDTLKLVDSELREVDSILYNHRQTRFAARGVAGIESPDQLCKHIETRDWVPVDASVHVTDLHSLVRDIGGEQLYGSNPHVPIRELMQNAGDAVRARSALYPDSNPGRVLVELDKVGTDWFLTISDDGIGMSERVLCRCLLDFGTSLWSSDLVRLEHPGLLTTSWKSAGRFGIGFFSIFMLGIEVTVASNKVGAAREETRVLEFGSGLVTRPLLRMARREEEIVHGGTSVRVKLKSHPESLGFGLLTFSQRSRFSHLSTLKDVCTQLAPAVDFDVDVAQYGQEAQRVVNASDWMTLSPEGLFERLYPIEHSWGSRDVYDRGKELFANRLRDVRREGELIARLAMMDGAPPPYGYSPSEAEVVVGGFTAGSLSGIAGVALGEAVTAARSSAESKLLASDYHRWVDEQADLLHSDAANCYPADLLEASTVLRCYGSDDPRLPFAYTASAIVTVDAFKSWVAALDSVVLIAADEFDHENPERKGEHVLLRAMGTGQAVQLHPRVATIGAGVWVDKEPAILDEVAAQFIPSADTVWSELEDWQQAWQSLARSLLSDAIRHVAVAWNVPLKSLLQQLRINRRGLEEVPIGTDEDGMPFHTEAVALSRPLS